MKGYTTVKQEAHIEIVINKSRFLGHCYPVESEAQSQQILEALRKTYWDASHNCFAYSIGETGSIARYSDDGEPGRTAGLPMMEVLHKKNITNLLVVVTRYFGGVLLGAGGLVRAYSKAAAAAVDAAGIVQMQPCRRMRVTLEYSRWGAMESYFRECCLVENVAFTEAITVTLLVPEKDAARFCEGVVQKTDGKIKQEETERLIYPFPQSAEKKLSD